MEPASAAALAVIKLVRKAFKQDARVVSIMTGHGLRSGYNYQNLSFKAQGNSSTRRCSFRNPKKL